MVSSEALQQFKKLYKKRYGKTLEGKEALTKANNLFNFYRAVYRLEQNINIQNVKKLQTKQN